MKFAMDLIPRTQLHEIRDARALEAGMNLKLPKRQVHSRDAF